VVSRPTKAVIEDALAAPREFATGSKRKLLQAAFDECWSELVTDLTRTAPNNRMHARMLLNDLLQNGGPPSRSVEICRAVSEAIRASENSLHDKDYDPDDPSATVAFIEGPLRDLREKAW
jgi:hypothetical protein